MSKPSPTECLNRFPVKTGNVRIVLAPSSPGAETVAPNFHVSRNGIVRMGQVLKQCNPNVLLAVTLRLTMTLNITLTLNPT